MIHQRVFKFTSKELNIKDALPRFIPLSTGKQFVWTVEGVRTTRSFK